MTEADFKRNIVVMQSTYLKMVAAKEQNQDFNSFILELMEKGKERA